MKDFDLLTTIEYGGCSSKLSAKELGEALSDLPGTPNENLLVDINTHDDAGVYKINDELAIIQTTDFFPPVCSNAYEFGQISASNALSDVYAMGGKVLTALNIVAFPTNIPLEVLKEILRGGIDKILEAGGVIMGGHTIVDDVPKYGLAVTGSVHPNRIITNSNAEINDVIILTKPIGTGIVMAGSRIGEVEKDKLQIILESMKQLNAKASEIMQKYNVRCATDITGFGLAGHTFKLASASNVTIKINVDKVPLFENVHELANMGCIPGACFRNMDFIETGTLFSENISFENKMIMTDAQTSGGLLICCKKENAEKIIKDLKNNGYTQSALIGEVVKDNKFKLIFEK